MTLHGITPSLDSLICSSGCGTKARRFLARRRLCITRRLRIPSTATACFTTGTYHPSKKRPHEPVPVKGVITMFAALRIGLLGAIMLSSAEPPDIAGQWSGEDWDTVVLKQ